MQHAGLCPVPQDRPYPCRDISIVLSGFLVWYSCSKIHRYDFKVIQIPRLFLVAKDVGYAASQAGIIDDGVNRAL